MNGPFILQEQDAPLITVLTLNRPEKRNALSMALMRELCGAVEDAGRDKTRRVIVIKGAGDAFCAGLDLKEASDSKNATSSARMVARMLLAVSQTPLITIAVKVFAVCAVCISTEGHMARLKEQRYASCTCVIFPTEKQ